MSLIWKPNVRKHAAKIGVFYIVLYTFDNKQRLYFDIYVLTTGHLFLYTFYMVIDI